MTAQEQTPTTENNQPQDQTQMQPSSSPSFTSQPTAQHTPGSDPPAPPLDPDSNTLPSHYGTIKAQPYEGYTNADKLFLSLIQVGSGYTALNEFTNLRREAANQEKLKDHNFATWEYVFRTSIMCCVYALDW